MTGINHYLVGTATAVVLKNPLLVIPVSFLSHFALDALPHFGVKFSETRGKILSRIAIVDTVLVILAIVLTIRRYPNWYALAGLVAIGPDFAWIYRFIVPEKFGTLPPKPENRFNSWHVAIQKLEFRWGMIIETGFVVLLSWLLFKG